jgi:hypothetical protein
VGGDTYGTAERGVDQTGRASKQPHCCYPEVQASSTAAAGHRGLRRDAVGVWTGRRVWHRVSSADSRCPWPKQRLATSAVVDEQCSVSCWRPGCRCDVGIVPDDVPKRGGNSLRWNRAVVLHRCELHEQRVGSVHRHRRQAGVVGGVVRGHCASATGEPDGRRRWLRDPAVPGVGGAWRIHLRHGVAEEEVVVRAEVGLLVPNGGHSLHQPHLLRHHLDAIRSPPPGRCLCVLRGGCDGSGTCHAVLFSI